MNGETSLKDGYIADSNRVYAKLQSEGKLASRGTNGLAHVISHQVSLSTANHISHNHPGPRARQELVARMSTLNHPKGAAWIYQHGQDRNLAGMGAERRVTNNRLKGVVEDVDDDDIEASDDDVLHVERSASNRNVYVTVPKVAAAKKPFPKETTKVAAKKYSPKKTAAHGKMVRLRNVCRRSINYEKDYDDLDEREQKKHDAQMGVGLAFRAILRFLSGYCTLRVQ